MKPATKKIISVFFILPGFTPLLFIVFFAIRQQSIYHHMEQKMEQQSLLTLTLADEEIIWMKKGKEITIQGKMFDIKSSEHTNGMTTFRGLFDDEETLLNKKITEGWEKNQSAQSQLLTQLFQCLQNIYFDPPADIPFISDNEHHLFSFISPSWLNQSRTILTPPPQV